MTDNFWDDPEIFDSGQYISFVKAGDSVTGRITAVKRHMFDDGTVVPRLELETADGPRSLTAGQVGLKRLLAEHRPNVGDTITVTMTGTMPRAGGKTLKTWNVVVGPQQPPAAPASTTTAPPPAPAPVTTTGGITPEQAAALGLSPEQQAALGNLI